MRCKKAPMSHDSQGQGSENVGMGARQGYTIRSGLRLPYARENQSTTEHNLGKNATTSYIMHALGR